MVVVKENQQGSGGTAEDGRGGVILKQMID